MLVPACAPSRVLKSSSENKLAAVPFPGKHLSGQLSRASLPNAGLCPSSAQLGRLSHEQQLEAFYRPRPRLCSNSYR